MQIDPDEGPCVTELVSLPRVNVRGEGANSPKSTPRIVVVAGATDDAGPDAYDTALHVLLDELREPQWLTWWSAAPDDVLEIWYDFVVVEQLDLTAT